MDVNVHDHFLYAWIWNATSSRLTLCTEYLDGIEKQPERHRITDVVFDEVLAHQFVEADSINILFDLGESPVMDVISRNWTTFQTSRNHGWPEGCREVPCDSIESFAAAIESKGFKSWTIASVVGASGWIIAKDVRQIARQTRAQF